MNLDHFNLWFAHTLGLVFLMAVIVLGVGMTLYSSVLLLSPRHRHV